MTRDCDIRLFPKTDPELQEISVTQKIRAIEESVTRTEQESDVLVRFQPVNGDLGEQRRGRRRSRLHEARTRPTTW
jgi:hypothetical protein